ncbi:hypothetical protein [Shewanella sp. 38A_GOM-205m]|uniref:hypothetical protein n=1 Tax=Shewanella sp. 38A_GOM-205m TaxID=1380363 RepID=UPI00048EFA57|nr:hypothetical protein [Shewanella sp. 38A_GOM-205m]
MNINAAKSKASTAIKTQPPHLTRDYNKEKSSTHKPVAAAADPAKKQKPQHRETSSKKTKNRKTTNTSAKLPKRNKDNNHNNKMTQLNNRKNQEEQRLNEKPASDLEPRAKHTELKALT